MLGSTLHNEDLDGDGVVDHVRFSIRNQFLHPNHPLGWIRKLTVSLDGEAIAPADMFFVVRGQWISVAHLPTITDIWWQMREMAELYIKRQAIEAGSHKVAVGFDVSMYGHTPSVDRDNQYPTIHEDLTTEMELSK
ncbi:MAG: hypothetical protein EON59_08910 [Alphaproteobacteria bacterium]|nr:MAG: hypothetical protein EON59_08910 [Alphaproteobacteria bacterium]